MARSATVLDWADIQVLVRICSHTIPNNEENFSELNTARHELVESFLRYFQSWQPDGEMDDEVRGPLVQALEEFAEKIKTKKKMFSRRGFEKEIEPECKRIAGLLRAAMEHSGSDEQGGPPTSPGWVGILICYLAAQGQFLTSFCCVNEGWAMPQPCR